MHLLTNFLLGISSLVLLVIIGAFVFVTLNTMFDVIVERKQARERAKKK